jgi:hypothetical protein
MLKFKTVFSLMGSVLVLLLVFKITMEIRDNYEDKEQDPYLLKLVDQLSQIPQVKEVVYRSGLKFFDSKKSYTINKKYVFICMYDKDGKLYPKNQLTLVLLHEIAHAICDEIGHTQKFQTILDELLEEAHRLKLYDPTIAPISGYCSHNV